MNKAIILDRDGTINVDSGYTYKIEDLEFFPDVFESLKKLKDFILIIISNQSGIGRGYYTDEDFHKFNDKLVEELKKQGIIIKKTYYCPHHPDEPCRCRKPNTKFIEDAKKEFDIDIKRSFVIGDHPFDVNLGKNAGCRSIYLLTGHGKKHEKELAKKPDFIAENLSEAVDWILKNEQ